MSVGQFKHGPPFIYAGLADYEELMSSPDLCAHAEDFRRLEAERVRREEREAEERYWRERCENGGMHRFGQCPYCGYFYD